MRIFYLAARCCSPAAVRRRHRRTAPSYVAMAPAIQDSNGKQFAPPPAGMAALYLFNPTTAGPLLNVVVNGREIGRLGTQTWMRAEFAAGEHNVRCGLHFFRLRGIGFCICIRLLSKLERNTQKRKQRKERAPFRTRRLG